MTIFNLTEPGANHCFSRHMSCNLLFQVSEKYLAVIQSGLELPSQAIQPLLRIAVALKAHAGINAIVDDGQTGKTRIP